MQHFPLLTRKNKVLLIPFVKLKLAQKKEHVISTVQYILFLKCCHLLIAFRTNAFMMIIYFHYCSFALEIFTGPNFSDPCSARPVWQRFRPGPKEKLRFPPCPARPGPLTFKWFWNWFIQLLAHNNKYIYIFDGDLFFCN